jgi:hypothetical protein
MTTFIRAPAFATVTEMLDWSKRHGENPPVVERGPDRTYRGSVEVNASDPAPEHQNHAGISE